MNSSAQTSLSINASSKPLLLRIFPDILAFAGGLCVAYFLKWDTTDLVWSLWLCSLVLGYLTLLSALAGGAYFWFHITTHKDFKKEQRLLAILAGLAIGIFYLAFFSLHFGGFHAGHSVFLQQFFPIAGMPEDGFGEAFTNPPLLWSLVFQHLMLPYGLFLIPAIVAERHYIFLPISRAVMTVHTQIATDHPIEETAVDQKGKRGELIGDAMGRPYINVIRMHMLIFFFAFSHAIKLDSFLVYAIVYLAYFFPWSEIKKLRTP